MIILKKYGVTLKQLTHDKIELVRQWRNHPKINKWMSYREFITPEMQENWFNRISNYNNYFFIVQYNGIEVGLINIRDIDEKRNWGESGIFIWDDSVLNKGVSVRAGLTLYDFAFNDLKLQYLVAHIFSTNLPSIHYHKKFGFIIDKTEDIAPTIPVNQLYILDSKVYLELSIEYKSNIAKITPPYRY